jgi:hypothetical protein
VLFLAIRTGFPRHASQIPEMVSEGVSSIVGKNLVYVDCKHHPERVSFEHSDRGEAFR